MSEVGRGGTRREWLRWATDRLRDAGVPDPVREAWRLLTPSDCEVPAFVTAPDATVDAREAASLDHLVTRRCRREPLAYIRRSVEFYSRTFCVDPRVLIPRPETETLVDVVLAMEPGAPPGHVVDVGTGSGVIAVTLALALADRPIVATDTSGEALQVARENVRRHGVSDRVRLFHGDLVCAPCDILAFAVVVANLPYVKEEEWATLAPEVSRWEPRGALVSGADGLDAIRRLVARAPRILLPGGWMVLEVGAEQGGEVGAMMRAAGLLQVRSYRDLRQIERVIVGRAPREDGT